MKSRKGSALLVVLGMLTFMIISAVAFSAYMRYSRMPSSFLRRTASSRQLVKAALAQAIDIVDASIGNNPHPGVGQLETIYPRSNGSYDLRNVWLHRVFFGENSHISASNTVPVLTLEALAYLPSTLINDVRYYSRLSPAAVWQNLDFDVGRFAFCAVDVSDHFDVNRITAQYPRSSDPFSRVSLAYLCENDAHTQSGTPSTFDRWLESTTSRSVSDTTTWGKPFISIADFNLALGATGAGTGFKSPFYEYISGSSSGSGLYGTSSPAKTYARQAFITDGYFPDTAGDFNDLDSSGKNTAIDLSKEEEQPFAADVLSKKGRTISSIFMGTAMQNTDEFKWIEAISGFGCVALCDYLDPDNIPTSLAIPTTERVPMICGIAPQVNGAKFTITSEDVTEGAVKSERNSAETFRIESQTEKTRTVSKTIAYRLNYAALQPNLSVMLAYPFSHKADDDTTSFSFDGKVSFFLSSGNVGLRTNGNTDLALMKNSNSGINNGVMNSKIQSKSVSVQAADSEEDVAWLEENVQYDTSFANELKNSGNELVKITYKWDQTKSLDFPINVGGVQAAGWGPDFGEMDDAMKKAALNNGTVTSGLPVFQAGGTVDSSWANEGALKKMLAGEVKDVDVQINMAVWLQLKSGSDVVDMVPACANDDIEFNGVSDSLIQLLAKQASLPTGAPYPLMRFNTKQKDSSDEYPNGNLKFRFSLEALDEAVGKEMFVEPWPKSVAVQDPRFNYAPEHWKEISDFTANGWLDSSWNLFGNGKHALDPFLATSDAGYMQSKYEIAMLPRFNALGAGGENYGGDMVQPYLSGTMLLESNQKVQNEDLMWRSYDPFGDDADTFNDLPIINGSGGFRVNPYSDSADVIMGAFANTPLDWKHSSVNMLGLNSQTDFSTTDIATFNKKYAWNEYSSGGKFAWSELKNVAANFMSAVRSKANDNWTGTTANKSYLPETLDSGTLKSRLEYWNANSAYPLASCWIDAYNSLDWVGTEESFCGADVKNSDPLWEVDRKFLYGFWKECFDTKQQLFLIFVRAEPVMMGGGGLSNIPPQLGARAVALVWRNPRPVYDSSGKLQNTFPHQTRVLFYRQLD